MNRLARYLARRRADLAQARRIAAARAESDAAWRALPWGSAITVHRDGRLTPAPRKPDQVAEANSRMARADATLARAEQNASPRARRQAALLYEWGSLKPPPRRLQAEIRTVREAASQDRSDVIGRVRQGSMSPAEADMILAAQQRYPHPRDPLGGRRCRGRSR